MKNNFTELIIHKVLPMDTKDSCVSTVMNATP